MNGVKKHFDTLAESYDFWKRKNSYYYSNLKKIYFNLIPKGKRILDIGCGTGDILANLEPSYGVGIDISQKIIRIAKTKYKNYKNLNFSTSKVSQLKRKDFDFIILADVIEHLENVNRMFATIANIVNSDTEVIITMSNPSWEPLLEIAEKLKLKMPEGPHERISDVKLLSILKKNGFEIISLGSRLLMPISLGKFSSFINENFHKFTPIRNLGLIHFFILRKKIAR